MNSWKVILATVVIFGAGVLTGGLLVNYVVHEHRNMPMPRPPSPGMWRMEFLKHLDKKLKLTPQQHAAISKIIADGQERNREIWTNIAAPKLREEMERVHQRIRAQLTPEQQKRFEEMIRPFAAPHPPKPPPATNNVPPPQGGKTEP